ncbi:MAG: LPS export ABC transporter periplasmic protein LptC [Flavobacteriales bacterium]|nr:LPS export ABC transporter periplasmic protein LptC [Flavobacteriales bacterium]MBK6944795.1 LPS export ABC transporter periplasmic protein LptC [Flavobacteriales bacterium]MBK7241056.1 LPS export ABC transporter periplasmic protein LptC [Flavobacteriales bacterium]MBP9139221.1 LPS export ABC transporter periplasmic protein LptC [Flavobacteriales bacterium]HQV52927.1 LPS export ABC transporter periplasmic protein LptC [Flavobacteriales bacterium]
MGPMVQKAPDRLTFIGAIGLFGLLAMVSCKNDLDNVAAVELPLASPDRVTFEAEYFFTDSGRVRNRLRAGKIEEFAVEPKHTELSDGLELVFFDSVGNPGSTLTARRGTILPKQQRMEVFEQVVFVNAKGERLETEQLSWHQDSAMVRTDKAVRVQRGLNVVHGQGLEAVEDFSRYTIKKVTGTLHLGEGDTLSTDAEDQ